MKLLLKVIGIIFLIIFIIVIIAFVGGFIFLKNLDVKKYKPHIIQAVSQALGRPVDFKDIDLKVSLEKGIRFHLTDFSAAENPDFGSGNFAVIEEIDAGVDILPFFMSRQISIPNVLIRSPRISVIRGIEGTFNIQTIGKPLQGSTQEKKPALPSAVLPAVFINSFKIENAEIILIDKSVNPEIKFVVTQLNLDVRRFSLINPFDVLLEAAVLSPRKNILLSGRTQLKLLAREARLSETEVTVDLGQLPLKELRTFPLLTGIPLPQVLEGRVKIKIKEAAISDKGLEKLNASVALSNGKVDILEIVPGISFEANQVNFGLENLTLDGSIPAKITVKAAFYQDQPNVDFSGMAAFDFKTMQVHLTEGQFATDFSLWPLDKIKAAVLPLKDVPLPERLSGKFQTTIKEAVVSAEGFKTILLDAKLEQGEAAFNNVVPGTSLALSKIDAAIVNFSLVKPFSVSLKAGYLSEMPNIFFDGSIFFDLNTQAVTVKDAEAVIDLDGFPLERFKASGFVPEGVLFPQVLAGKMKFLINDLAVSPKGIDRMKTDIQWQNGKIAVNEIAPGISMAASKISLYVKDFALDHAFGITASFGYESDEPNISLDGKMAFDLTTQNVCLSGAAVKTELSKIPFERLKTKIAFLKDVSLPEVINGQLEVNVKELSAGPQGLDFILADAVLKEGEVIMKEAAPGISFAASHINVEINNFGLETPFAFNVRLAYLNSEPNIHAKGTAIFHIKDQSVTLKDTTAQADIAAFSMDSLRTSVAALKDVSLPEKLKGDLNVVIESAGAGPKGLSVLSGNGSLKNWEVKFKELAVPIRGSDTSFKMTENLFSIDDFQADLGKGQITAKVGVADYMTRQDFDFSGEIKGINLAEILDQKDASVKAEGLVFGNIKAKGQAADFNSITGEGNFEVKEAKLKDFNVLKTVLDKISFLPNVSSRVEAKLPENYKQKLKNKDTEIKKVTVLCMIANGAAALDPISVEADEFIFSGKCNAGFDQKYALDGKVKIPTELSAAMGEGIDELKYLYDENSNISLPVHVTGKGADIPVVAVTQTAIDMGKNAMRNEGKKQLDKILNKVLGTGDGQTPPSDAQDQEGVPSQEEKSPGSQIIDGIFDKIFKK